MPDDADIAPDFSDYSAAELGYPGPKPPPPGNMPPGDGRLAIPNFLSFSALVRSAARAYLYSSDEALRDSVQNAKAMRRDPVLMGALRTRQRPTAQLSWHITPEDETDPSQQEAGKLVTYIIERIPRFQKMKMQLLEAIWFGKYAVEVAYEWRNHRGRQTLFIRDFIPINGDKIRYKWDGTPGFLVYPGYPGTKEATDYGMAHFLTAEERMQYIIHEHEPDDADWMDVEMAGAIHGVGIRGRLYWFWWLKQQVFGLMMNYLNRFANGMTIFYYNASNPQAKTEAIAAARAQFTQSALIYPRWASENPDTNKVERLEVGTASPALLWNLVNDYFDPIMIRYINGQTLSTDHTGSGGLGGTGAAKLAGDTQDEILKYDAVDLGETFQTDLVNVLYAYNAPGVPPGRFGFEVDSPNSEELMTYAQILYEWGVPLSEEQAYKISQWTKPKPGEGIISNLGTMQPAAIGGVEGVPVAGQAGPPGQQVDASQLSPEQQAELAASQPPSGGGGAPMAFRRNGKGHAILKRKLPKKRMLVIT